LPLTISASLSWLEFGNIEYDNFGLFLAPLLAIAQGFNVVIIKKSVKNFALKNHELSFGLFSLYHTGTITLALAFPAFISYLRSRVSYDASWESIDYVLMMTSIIFMMCYKFSELWLISNTDIPIYFALEHSKFFAGSIGQWWLQNMAHASVFAFVGKIIFIASSLRFWQNVELLPKRQTN
uniref:NADH dehydrogenase subunit 5 n=1 Tax=Panagrolaimus sp. JU765 TaxID=591449 RepID=A0AC34QD07_9BILA